MTNRRAALAGAVSVGVAFGSSELVAALLRQPSPIRAVGDVVVDNVPIAIKDWAIATLGTYDKPVLITGIVLIGLAIGAAIGVFRRRGRTLARVGFAAFAGLGALAARIDQVATLWGPWLVGLAGALTGIVALDWLTRERSNALAGRRDFILRAGSVAGLGIILAAGGRALASQLGRLAARRDEVILPRVATPVPAPAPSNQLAVADLTPIVVPNDDFYRIDTALTVPQVDLSEWSLSVSGMVDRPFTVRFEDLLDMPMVEHYVTLSCVSNPVGGDLVGNARWQGVPLVDLLDRARVQARAEQLVGISVDDFTVGFPVAAAYDGRTALVAVGMNGQPLPFEHGFPARLVVAGLYGYVSATKWLREINLTSWDGFDAYWVPRGWAKEAPIKIQSRIDTPRPFARLEAGPKTVAGVAWSPNLGISLVEVQVDEEPWRKAEVSSPLSIDSWVQWRIDHLFSPGTHVIRVRATDGRGQLQDQTPRPPPPDGATGWHRVTINVS